MSTLTARRSNSPVDARGNNQSGEKISFFVSTFASTDQKFEFGFDGFLSADSTGTAVGIVDFKTTTTPACTSAGNHEWQLQPIKLLSNPPQSVYYCIHCPAVRHISDPAHRPRVYTDAELDAIAKRNNVGTE